MATFVNDTFTEASDTDLSAHTGETGATWTKHPSFPTERLTVYGAGDYVRPKTGATFDAFYYASGSPAGVEYDVSADITIQTSAATNGVIGIAGRIDTTANTKYCARYNVGAGAWQLIKYVAGAATTLGTYSQTLSYATPYNLRLEITDATKKVFIDGVERISSADNVITAAGKAGLCWYLNVSNQYDLTLDNFVASDIGGAFVPAWGRNANVILGA